MTAAIEHRPRIALTMGDVAGIGPEVIARAWSAGLLQVCEPVVVGHPIVMARAASLVDRRLAVVELDGIAEGEATATQIPCWNPGDPEAADVPPGKNDPRAGRAAYEYLRAAGWAAQAGAIEAITTAPLSKAALHLAGLHYPGHTEILAELCGVTDFAMQLYLPRPPSAIEQGAGLGVAHVTLHTSIASVPQLLSTPRIVATGRLLGEFLRRVGFETPRLGICALNPHAGEEGLFGDEEQRYIAPAVELLQQEGWQAAGPHPADTLLKRAWEGEFDGVVAMYHDQGHIALKLLGFDRAVNVTLGLPIVRTSPSHGTAFDIAWQGKARGDGMWEAIQIAAALARTAR
ncbi:MAG: 4-hydroxythreonine-4-phosphate dehydrogenase PdxA [Planctomycetaceae bacterium]|jgi:4-hydroxythreonine-4-phosphate dehydrogenase